MDNRIRSLSLNKLEYSNLVKRKMKKLKKWLTEHYDLNTAKSILSEMMSDADRLKEYDETVWNIWAYSGVNRLLGRIRSTWKNLSMLDCFF